MLKTDINLLTYLDALAIRLNVSAGNYEQLLKTDATVGQLIQAAIDVLKLGSDAVKVVINNLEAIKLIAPGTEILHLGDLVKIQNGTDKSALDVNLQLFNLIQGFVQLSNKKSAVAVELPVNVLGLLGITVKTKVIEPAQISAIGNPKLIDTQPIFVRTAQVRTLISVDLPVISTLNDVIGWVMDLVGGLLGGSLDPKIGPKIDVALEAASGSGYVSGYRCNGPKDKQLSVVGTTSAVRLMVGQIDPKNLFSSVEQLKVDEFPLLDLGRKICSQGVCASREAYAVGGLGLMIDSTVAETVKEHVFLAPPEVKQPADYYGFSSNNVVGSLSNTLNGIKLISHTPTLGGLLGLVLSLVVNVLTSVLNLLSGVISGLLSPLLDPLVNNLLAGLGIDLAKVEIGANLSCNPGGRAILVI